MNISSLISKQWKMLLLLAITLPLSYNCVNTPSSPVPPRWSTQLTVQLIKRTYFFNDMISKDSSKYTTINGELVYKPAALDNQPTAITLPSMTPFAASFVQSLGLIPIAAVSVPGLPFSFKGMTGADPPPAPWPGTNLTKDTTIIINIDSSTFDYLVYEEGQMKLTVLNTFNFDINFSSPVQIVNTDKSGADLGLIGNFNIGTVLKNGASRSDSVSLVAKKLNALIRMKFTFTTVGLPGTIINSGAISMGMGITKPGGGDPSLSEAKMLLKNEYVLPVTTIKDSVQKLDDKDVVAPIDSTTFIKSATFKGGSFDINIVNGIPFDVVIGFNLREFIDNTTSGSFKLLDKTTGKRADSITIKGKSTYFDPVEMKNYTLRATKENPKLSPALRFDTLTSGIHFSLNIKTLVKSPVKVVIKKTDSILVEIKPKVVPYLMDVVQGKIPPNIVAINDTVSAGIGSSGDNFSADSVKFDGAQILLRIFTKSLFPTDLKFTVKGFSDGQVSDSLSTPKGKGLNASPDGVSYRIFPGDTAKILFDKFNPDAYGKNIDQFLSRFTKNGKFKFPDKFAISGNAIIEPVDQYNEDPKLNNGRSVGIVKDNDSVFTSMEFSFPLKIGIVNGLYLADTASIGSNVDTTMTSSIVEGTIGFNLASTFPVALDIYSNLIKADPNDATKPSKNSSTNSVLRFPKDSTKLPLGVPGALDNQVKVEYRDIVLTGDDAKKIAEARFNAVEIRMKTAADNGNTPLAFVKNDSIQLITIANIKFKVDYDKFK